MHHDPAGHHENLFFHDSQLARLQKALSENLLVVCVYVSALESWRDKQGVNQANNQTYSLMCIQLNTQSNHRDSRELPSLVLPKIADHKKGIVKTPYSRQELEVPEALKTLKALTHQMCPVTGHAFDGEPM